MVMPELQFEDCECLNSWPKGTVGYNQEHKLISALYAASQLGSIDELDEVAKEIARIWRDISPTPGVSMLNLIDNWSIDEPDWVVVRFVLVACNQNGFGRVPQVVEQMKDILNNPEKVVEYKKSRRQRLDLLEESRKYLEDTDE